MTDQDVDSGRWLPSHGWFGTPTYSSWQAMKTRCRNARSEDYKRYGALGIDVCDRWADSFELFLADMGPRLPGTTLDRYPDKAGNYEPGNCRWATAREQAVNRATTKHFVLLDGDELPLRDACERIGLSPATALSRINSGLDWRYGWRWADVMGWGD